MIVSTNSFLLKIKKHTDGAPTEEDIKECQLWPKNYLHILHCARAQTFHFQPHPNCSFHHGIKKEKKEKKKRKLRTWSWDVRKLGHGYGSTPVLQTVIPYNMATHA